MASHPRKTSGDDRWNREKWLTEPRYEALGRDVVARFGGGDFSLFYKPFGEAVDEMISMVNGEFVQWLSEIHNGPAAFVLDRPEAVRFGWDRILTVFEQAMFDTREPWPVVFDRLGMRCVAVEQLDGMRCWRLENARDAQKTRLTVWVSIDHDLAPFRVHQVYLSDTGEVMVDAEMRVTAYTRVGDSFLPGSTIISGTNRYVSTYQMSAYDIEEIKVGEQYHPMSILAGLPEGTHVTDLVHLKQWKVGERGARTDLRPVNMEHRRAAEMARDAQVKLPYLKRARGIAMALIGVGTAGVVVFVVLAVRRRRVAA